MAADSCPPSGKEVAGLLEAIPRQTGLRVGLHYIPRGLPFRVEMWDQSDQHIRWVIAASWLDCGDGCGDSQLSVSAVHAAEWDTCDSAASANLGCAPFPKAPRVPQDKKEAMVRPCPSPWHSAFRVSRTPKYHLSCVRRVEAVQSDEALS